jgi:hypothetical protein
MGTSEQPFTQSELQTMCRHCIICRDLVRSDGAASMRHQPQLPGLEVWLQEREAAQFVGLDTKTLRDLRAGHWQGITPYEECDGKYYYCCTDLDGYNANRAER